MALQAEQVGEGLYWANVYWMDGETPKGSIHRSEVKDPPHLGWGLTYVVDTGGKLVTLFCPFTLEGHQVSRGSFEYQSMVPARQAYPRQRMAQKLMEKWAQAVANSWQRDFGTCAVVMRALGIEVPMNLVPEGVEVKTTGGKEADDVLGLTKPVKRSGRRGQVLAFFMAGEGHARSIHEATAEMGITRSNLLSQAYLLQKDHGIGYEVAGDVLRVLLPADCTDPFEREAEIDPLDC